MRRTTSLYGWVYETRVEEKEGVEMCSPCRLYLSPRMLEKTERSHGRDGEGEGKMSPLAATVALI